MVYDRQPSRDNDYGNSHESNSFSYTRGNSLPSSNYHDEEVIERLRKYYQQRQAETWAAKQQQWFDSLPVFNLGEESDRDSRKEYEGRKKKQPAGETLRVDRQEKEEETEAEESGKKKKGLFSWLNSRGKGDKEQSGKPKPNQDKNQSDFSILPKPQAKDNQQPNTSSQEETNTGVEIGNDQNRATSKSTQNRKSSNSNESPGGSSANLNSSADVTSIAPVRVEPIFIAPSLDLANTKQENVLGKNPDGSVIYISENPSADRASAQAGVGVSELPSSQTERIYSQQQEIAQTAVDSVVDRGKSVGATIKSTSPDSLTRIDSATKAATASIETEIEKQLSAIASLMNQSRSSISAASNKEIERIENHHANTISAIDARSETAVNQLEASAEKISQQMASSNATFSRRIDSVIEYNHAAISEKQQRARQTIDVIERTNIKKFRKQSPTKSDNPIVRALDNIGWNAYVTNWREAKIQVARGVAKASHQANTELFNNNFAKLAEYRTTTVNGGASLIASYQEALSNGHRQHKNAIRAKAGAALAQADQLKQHS